MCPRIFGSIPESFKDLASYYRTPTAFHEIATHTCLPRSWDIMATFNAVEFIDFISPRPLLMITGTKAATAWYSEDAIEKAKEPKKLVVLDGLTHADLYDHVDEAGPLLVEFFGEQTSVMIFLVFGNGIEITCTSRKNEKSSLYE